MSSVFSSTNLRDTAKRLSSGKLTGQQRKILELIAAEPGLKAKEIAHRLGITQSNVEVQLFYMRPLVAAQGLKIVNGFVVRGAE